MSENKFNQRPSIPNQLTETFPSRLWRPRIYFIFPRFAPITAFPLVAVQAQHFHTYTSSTNC